mgnify:CR=1 FL=1|jgi:hypothetical protein|tara:strand:- start:390 stop:698 length:309 start_codon:yes stop_codon:yes gene_type:complete
MPYSKEELKNNLFYQELIREDEQKYMRMILHLTDSGDKEEGVLRDINSGNILIFEKIIPGQGTDGTVYSVGDLHTIEYDDGYFDYLESEELNNIIDREFTEF